MLGPDGFVHQFIHRLFGMEQDAGYFVAHVYLITRRGLDGPLFEIYRLFFGEDGIDNSKDLSSRSGSGLSSEFARFYERGSHLSRQ